ncbi:MAG: RNB domain-containing ribonuclease, partial [Raineya sp.]
MNYKQVASRLQLSDKNDRERVKMALEIMARNDEIEMPDRGKYRYISLGKIVEGRIDMTQSGAAYLVIEGENTEDIKDVYISPKHIGKALDKDLVQVQLFDFGRESKPAGEVIQVLERAKTEFVGVIEIVPKKHAFLVADSRKMAIDLFIPLDKMGAAQDGDKVIVKMTEWPEDAKSPIGEVIKVLGRPGEHETEIHSILAEYDLPYEFPKEVERDAENVPVEIKEDEIKKRRDFRQIPTLTIDPVDAKDFDDALSIRLLENGLYEIGIHIADVTYYVTPDSKLEEEAQKRATSVYLVDRVVPMLPEKLSNLVCSLRPNEEKYTFSAVFEMDLQGKVHTEWFGRTLINSQRRFTYEEAGAVIKTGMGDMVFEITTLNNIAKN